MACQSTVFFGQKGFFLVYAIAGGVRASLPSLLQSLFSGGYLPEGNWRIMKLSIRTAQSELACGNLFFCRISQFCSFSAVFLLDPNAKASASPEAMVMAARCPTDGDYYVSQKNPPPDPLLTMGVI